jgi:hypothetical protein
VPVILCDEWNKAQVKATWAELVALERKELKALAFDLELTGFEPIDLDQFLLGRR